MHPGTRILLSLLSALALPGLSFFYLAGLSLGLLPFIWRDRERLLSLLRRTRWLFLALLLGYAYSLPGDAVLAGWAGSPSVAGTQAGLLQVWRLALLIVLIDGLVLRLAPEALLAGIYGLTRPLRGLGLNPERLAVRLGLTLQALDRLGTARLDPLRVLDDSHRAASLPGSFELELSPWRRRDYVALAAALLVLGGLWLSAS